MAHHLVTGGAGFIGSHLVRRLLADGHDVRVLDNLSTGRKHVLSDIINAIEFLEGDIREPADCQAACRGIDTVFHQAALPSVPRSVEDPLTYHQTNVDGTFQLFLAARDAGCRRVVYAASSSAYGDQPQLPKHESMTPDPLSPYALHKLIGEYYAKVFHVSYGLESFALRYFNVFGPYQDPHSQYAAVIPALVTAMAAGRAPVIFGDGEQTRDLTHIDNVVQANLKAATAAGATGQVLNIACGERISINQLVAVINRLMGTDMAPRHEAARAGDVRHSWADISRAREIIGFEPTVMFEDGLARTIEWYRANPVA